MRVATNSNAFINTSLIKLKDDVFLANQRKAGKIAAGALTLLAQAVKDKTTKSLLELDQMAEEYILSHGGIPTFKGYGTPPFPSSVCISVNKQLVHGVATDYFLQEGDLVSFDLGATVEGAIGDTAITVIYGEPKSLEHVRLIEATQECLNRGIAAVKVGSRVGEIGHAISKCARGHGYDVYTSYGGHGLEHGKPHAAPFIANRAHVDEGIRIQAGMCLAIEPLLTRGSTETYIAEDNWTVVGKQLNAHFEHTIYVHEAHVEIITAREP